MSKQDIENLIVIYNYNLQGKVATDAELDILKDLITREETKRRKVNNRNNNYNKKNRELANIRQLMSYYRKTGNEEKLKELEEELNTMKNI